MRLRTAIKWLHGLLTTILLMMVIGFMTSTPGSEQRSEDKVITSQQLDSHTWLYVTGFSGGGATVADSYRYYLTGKIEGDAAAELAKQIPFLIAAGRGANVSVEGEVINISYSGRVFSFSNSIVYEYKGETFRPQVSFQARN